MNRDVCEHFNPVDLPCDKCKGEAINRDYIIRMAREACETTSWKPGLGNEHVVEFMARFAALVTAAEREACAKVCEEQKRKYEERAAKPQNIRDISPEVARIAGIACDFDAAAIRARTP